MCVISGVTMAGVMTALKVVGSVLAVASTAISIPTSIQAGNTQKAMYNYQAQVNENNAKIAQNNAAQERQSGLEEARLQRIKTLQNIGSQQAAFAGNGIDITSGTALDAIEDTAQFGELDALMTQYNSERTALNYEQQASNFTNQANLDRIAGKNASTAGKMNALAYGLNGLSQGLGTLGSVAEKWNPPGKETGRTPPVPKKTPNPSSGGYKGRLPKIELPKLKFPKS